MPDAIRDPREVLTRPAREPDAVLLYGDLPDQLIDVHVPDGPHRAPLVVLLHGGFWRQEFDRTHTRPLAEALARAGLVVATPEFRRVGGDGGWPRTFEDVLAALGQLARLDEVVPGRTTSEVSLLGHSAGGHLAVWAAQQPGVPPIRRVVALAPVADLYEAHTRRLGEGAVEELMGGTPEELSEAYSRADAARLLPGRVPVTVIHGVLDERVPVDLSRRLPGVEYAELSEVEHFGLIDPLSPAWPRVLAAVLSEESR